MFLNFKIAHMKTSGVWILMLATAILGDMNIANAAAPLTQALDTAAQPASAASDNEAVILSTTIGHQEQELLIASLAITKSSSAELQKFGGKIIAEQESLLAGLNELRVRNKFPSINVNEPADVVPDDSPEISKLKATGGDSFDRKWLDAMIMINGKTMSDYESNAAHTDNVMVKKVYQVGLDQLKLHQAELETFRSK